MKRFFIICVSLVLLSASQTAHAFEIPRFPWWPFRTIQLIHEQCLDQTTTQKCFLGKCITMACPANTYCVDSNQVGNLLDHPQCMTAVPTSCWDQFSSNMTVVVPNKKLGKAQNFSIHTQCPASHPFCVASGESMGQCAQLSCVDHDTLEGGAESPNKTDYEGVKAWNQGKSIPLDVTLTMPGSVSETLTTKNGKQTEVFKPDYCKGNFVGEWACVKTEKNKVEYSVAQDVTVDCGKINAKSICQHDDQNRAYCQMPDTDKDGVTDEKDNCKFVVNPDQLDTDKDGIGDVCACDPNNDGDVSAAVADPVLRNAIREKLGILPGQKLTLDDAAKLVYISRDDYFISLGGIGCFSNLEYLALYPVDSAEKGKINNLLPLEFLKKLTVLRLPFYQITDLTPLQLLTNLSELYLSGNQIKDIQPLLDNPGLGVGDTVYLDVPKIPAEQINALKAKGVEVK